MSSEHDAIAEITLYELKQRAKWSGESKEKKLAITGMLAHGSKAISSLEEIFNVTAYEDIRSACADAIRTIKGDLNPNHSEPMDLQISEVSSEASAMSSTSAKSV